jgi:hypothetical protein
MKETERKQNKETFNKMRLKIENAWHRDEKLAWPPF